MQDEKDEEEDLAAGEEEGEAALLEEESGEASMQQMQQQQPMCHDSFKVHQITDQVFICAEHLLTATAMMAQEEELV